MRTSPRDCHDTSVDTFPGDLQRPKAATGGQPLGRSEVGGRLRPPTDVTRPSLKTAGPAVYGPDEPETLIVKLIDGDWERRAVAAWELGGVAARPLMYAGQSWQAGLPLTAKIGR